eukprot:5993108-Prymnesium_polylepis.1
MIGHVGKRLRTRRHIYYANQGSWKQQRNLAHFGGSPVLPGLCCGLLPEPLPRHTRAHSHPQRHTRHPCHAVRAAVSQDDADGHEPSCGPRQRGRPRFGSKDQGGSARETKGLAEGEAGG